jgi:hypothetical protein
VIFRYLINCYLLPAENAVVKNPIAALKKKHFGFYTSVFWALIVGQNPFSQRKNPSNKGDTRLLPTPQNNGEIDELVTTRHLFWPNEGRKRALLLPIWLPIPTVLVPNCPRLWRSRARLLRLHQK